ncbi:MAG: hypothetical protein QM534_18350 [Sediminibacterium sp.]|nr:hypothetical protein [Sediminibacterium sp.]
MIAFRTWSRLLFLVQFTCQAQEKIFPVSNPNVFIHNNAIFLAGLRQNANTCVFKLYRLDPKWERTDSIEVNLGVVKTDQFLPISFDSLHKVFNFSVQRKDIKNKTTVLRFTPDLKLICHAPHVDIARVNSLTNFQQDRYISGNELYAIRQAKDTSGQAQFYLSAFHLKDISKPFEYDFKWQFAFDRQFIKTAHIFYADKQQVMVFVDVKDGSRKGQWLLRINAQNGFLIRGTRLNTKTEKAVYYFSEYFRDSLTKDILVLGQRKEEQAVASAGNGQNRADAFVIKLDSMGNIMGRTIAPLRFTEAKAAKADLKPVLKTYALSLQVANRLPSSELIVDANVYEVQSDKWLYADSYRFILTPIGDDYTFDRQQEIIRPEIGLFFRNRDPLNTNGTITADSINGNTGLYYSKRDRNFLMAFKTQETIKTYILQKTDAKKQIQEWQRFLFNGKSLSSTKLAESNSLARVQLVAGDTYVITVTEKPDVNSVLLKQSVW